tara:strand:- start:423 stop:665 length:243 start_codon:yes stop_codon:yes gene_type:complete
MEDELKFKVGDLIVCNFQPGVAVVKKDRCLPMKHTIKGEIGIVVGYRHSVHGEKSDYKVSFPQFQGYTHTLSISALNKIC